MRRLLALFTLFTFGLLIQMPAIHSLDAEKTGIEQNAIETRELVYQRDLSCPITSNESPTACYQLCNLISRSLPPVASVKLSLIVYSVPPYQSTQDFLDTLYSLHSFQIETIPLPKKTTPGRFAELVGIIKITS